MSATSEFTPPTPHGTVPPRAARVALSAALGCAFLDLTYQGIVEFWVKPFSGQVDDIVAIVLVGIGVVLFIEPLLERLRSNFGLAHTQDQLPQGSSRSLRLLAFLILAIASVSHALLHDKIREDPAGAFGLLLSALIIPAGITYAWKVGSHHRRAPRAAQLGCFCGAFLAIAMMFVIWVLNGGNLPVDGEMRRVPAREAEFFIIVATLPWPIMGLAGGLVIDRGWGSNRAKAITAAILIPMLVLDVLAVGLAGVPVVAAGLDMAKALGWGLGLIVIDDGTQVALSAPRHIGQKAPAKEATAAIPTS